MKIPGNSTSTINDVLDNAYYENRSVLFEHEVYKILSSIGLSVPKHLFVNKASKLSANHLTQFGNKIVVKVVSSDIAHKQKLGGVKVINNYDILFVQYVLEKMQEEVLSHFDNENKPGISGFLIVEFIEFTQSLGNELLIGIKSDYAFGPVLTLSKGGDDAEFFAKYYDPANLFLPHFTYEQATRLVNSLSIKHKFESIGHPEYLEYIAKAASLISSLAYSYSPVNEDANSFYIDELDINPFVITKDNRFVAVDGYAAFRKINESSLKKKPVVNENNIAAFFKPNGIAVVGVSTNALKYSMGREIARLLHDMGREDLYCINIKGGTTVIGSKQYVLYKSIDDLPSGVDLVVYTAPARFIPDFFKSLTAHKPRAVILIPGIPSNVDYGDFVEELSRIVPYGTRVVGPNCMGVYYGTDSTNKGLNTLFIGDERLHIKSSPKCNTLLLTQSGGIGITMLDKMGESPVIKSIVSFGNKFDVKIVDLISYFAGEDTIEVIALYVEGFNYFEGRLFYDLSSNIKKPLIVYKGGKTKAGAKAAASHTASMTGDYEVFKAVCNQSNVILIDDLQLYYECVKAFSLLSQKNVAGYNTSAVFNAGFEATIASDELGNLNPAVLENETIRRLEKINTHGFADISTSILDVTPMTDDTMYGNFIESLLEDGNVHSLIVGIVPHVDNLKATPDTCRHEDSLANILVRLFKKYDKPIVVSVNAGEYYKDFVSIMQKSGIPVFSDIRSAVKALDLYVTYHTARQ